MPSEFKSPKNRFHKNIIIFWSSALQFVVAFSLTMEVYCGQPEVRVVSFRILFFGNHWIQFFSEKCDSGSLSMLIFGNLKWCTIVKVNYPTDTKTIYKLSQHHRTFGTKTNKPTKYDPNHCQNFVSQISQILIKMRSNLDLFILEVHWSSIHLSHQKNPLVVSLPLAPEFNCN